MNTGKIETQKGSIGYLWRAYKSFVENATIGNSHSTDEDITFWRDRLFTYFIIYLLPTCFIALVPSVFMSFSKGLWTIGMSDIAAVAGIAFVSLNTRLSLMFRKIFMVLVLYALSILLTITFSLLGPGIIYLLSLSVLVTVIFPRHWGYWTILANMLICLLCAFVIHFRVFQFPLITDYAPGLWVSLSSNLLFLSVVLVMLISNAIRGLEQTLIKERLVKNNLKNENAERVVASLKLVESESQYKSLFFLSPSPMWILDTQSLLFLAVNEAAINSYGYTSNEFLAMSIREIKLEEDIDTLHKDIQMNLANGTPLSVVTKHRRKNKEHFPVEVIFNSILFKGRAATLVISRDITEQVDYIQAIETQNSKLRKIAWIQSHELRAPLARILGFVELFKGKLPDITNAEIIRGIETSSAELDLLIQEITYQTIIGEVRSSSL